MRALCGGAGFDPRARVALPGNDEGYAEFAREDFPPRMYPLVMDRAGIDYMVVYPSVGLLSTAATELAPDAAPAADSCMAVLSCGVQNHSAALENDSFEPLKRSAETQPVA